VSNHDPLGPRALLAGLIVAVLGGTIVAYLSGEGRFAGSLLPSNIQIEPAPRGEIGFTGNEDLEIGMFGIYPKGFEWFAKPLPGNFVVAAKGFSESEREQIKYHLDLMEDELRHEGIIEFSSDVRLDGSARGIFSWANLSFRVNGKTSEDMFLSSIRFFLNDADSKTDQHIFSRFAQYLENILGEASRRACITSHVKTRPGAVGDKKTQRIWLTNNSRTGIILELFESGSNRPPDDLSVFVEYIMYQSDHPLHIERLKDGMCPDENRYLSNREAGI